MGKLEGPHRRVNEVSGVGCFGRVMGLKVVGSREGTPEVMGKSATMDG